MGPVPVVRVFTSNQASGGNAMPRVATYYQLQDSSIDVSTFLRLSQVVADTPAGGEGALVTWQAAAVPGGTLQVTYTVEVNGNPIGDYLAFDFTPAGLPTASIPVQEATITSDVHQGSNQIVFRVTSTTGDALRLSSVMLWHRVNV
jgi:hypothetical protein